MRFINVVWVKFILCKSCFLSLFSKFNLLQTNWFYRTGPLSFPAAIPVQEFQSIAAALWPVGLNIFVKSVWGLFYHYFQSNPHLGCAISVGQFSSKSQQSCNERVQMLLCEKTCRFGIYFSLTALIHLYKGFSLKKWPKSLELKGMLVICHSTQGTWIWGPHPKCTEMSLGLSADLNELWIRLTKAFGVSRIQAPLLSHGCKHGLSMSLA